MFSKKNQYLKVHKKHQKALKVVFNSDKGYDKLLQMNNAITIQQKHLDALIREVQITLTLSICGLTSHLKYNVYYQKWTVFKAT